VRITRFTASVTVKLGSLKLRYLTNNYYQWICDKQWERCNYTNSGHLASCHRKTHDVCQRIHQCFVCTWNLHLLNYAGSAGKRHLSLPTDCHIKLGWLTDCSQLCCRGGGVTVNRLHAHSTIIGVIVKYNIRANPATTHVLGVHTSLEGRRVDATLSS
jgi:hypothetical protein